MSQLSVRTCFCDFGTNICGITSNLSTIFLIDYFCSISLNAKVPLLLYCVQGAANIE